MNKKLLTLAVAYAFTGALTTAHASSHGGDADGKPMVSYNGSLGFKFVDQDSNGSWEFKNTKARLGVNAVQATDVGKFIGQLEFDYDNGSNANDQSANEDEIDVRVARVVWKTKESGTAVFAARSGSGNYAVNYAHMDIFNHGGYHFFQQPDFTGDLIAYVSPKFSGVQGAVAIFANNAANDEDQDVQHFRVWWGSGPYKVGYGNVESNTSPADDTTRETLSFVYEDGPLMVGLTNEDQIGNNGTTVLGIAASYTAGDHTFSAANYSQDSDLSSIDGLSATTLEYSYAINNFTNAFVTIDQFDITDTTDDDATVFGINMKW